jgi:lysophospholipase L1-like esterase
MDRFDRHGLRRFRARDALVAVAVAAVVLVLFEGTAIRRAGHRMDPGPGRTFVELVGRPAGWIADQLPFAAIARRLTAPLSPDPPLAAGDAFTGTAGRRAAGDGFAPVTAAAFDPGALGAAPAPRRPLHTLLVTGDSLSTPLDTWLARALIGRGVRVIRDPHLGTGISKSFVADWGQLSAEQTRRDRPDAVVVFIGANEGFPLPAGHARDVRCCGAAWAAAYATRARTMARTYRRDGAARVYWITVPMPRDPARRRISRVVNAAVAVAVEPWRRDVRLVDTVAVFTPHGYRDAMPIAGRRTIVRESDGIHLNDAGSALLARLVLARLNQDFTYRGSR